MKYIITILLFTSLSSLAQTNETQEPGEMSETHIHLELGNNILTRRVVTSNYELVTTNLVPRFSISFFRKDIMHTVGAEGLQGVFYKLQVFPNNRINRFNLFFNYSTSLTFLSEKKIRELSVIDDDTQMELFWENCIGYGFEFRITEKLSLLSNIAMGVSFNNYYFTPTGNFNLGIRFAID